MGTMIDAPPEAETATPPNRRCTSLAAALAITLFLIGLCLRLTLLDRVPYLATLFYLLPLPVLTALAFSIALLNRRRRLLGRMRFWGLTTLLLLAWSGAELTQWSAPVVSDAEPIRVLCWNTCRGWLGWEGVASYINDLQPDIAGLVEADEWSEDRRAFWQQSCPGYHVSMLGGRFLCLTKEPPGEGVAVHLPDEGQYRRLDITVRKQTFTLFIVDLKSDPLQSRKTTLAALARDADALDDRPLVVMGDFNTPIESVHLASLRQRHRQAFEAAGVGYLPTWPVPLPVLCLDHIWVNSHLQVQRCWHGWSGASDHRPVVAELTIRPPVQKLP